uniref:Copper-containing nitrite reductase n=1 Tax=Mesocestoides corti TaxID=53468 RepID=A0A5K3FE64_MESCO
NRSFDLSPRARQVAADEVAFPANSDGRARGRSESLGATCSNHFYGRQPSHTAHHSRRRFRVELASSSNRL